MVGNGLVVSTIYGLSSSSYELYEEAVNDDRHRPTNGCRYSMPSTNYLPTYAMRSWLEAHELG